MMIGTRLKVLGFNLIEECKVALFFYTKSLKLFFADLYFHALYLTENPFRTSRKFLQKKGQDDVYKYGETPITTFFKIIEKTKVTSNDSFLELGAGRFRTLFFLNIIKKCAASGVEVIPSFCQKAIQLKKAFSLEGFDVLEKDFYDLDLSHYSVIYLYGTSMSDFEIFKLIERFKKLSNTVKIITISYPLSDYSNHFKIIDKFPVRFPWGITSAYIQTSVQK
ncbi:MAG TPA: hypothetical protein P5048_03670 [Chlamydiales bacterium]|nr:hypothetical protein [Chlamydiales bacterium]